MKFIAILVALLPLLISCNDKELDTSLSATSNLKINIYKNLLDLDEIGLIEQIRLENPKHYYLIKQIQNEIPLDRFTKLEVWLKTGHKLDDFYISKFIKTSYPPKRELFFMIDNTSYSITVTDQPYTLQGFLVQGIFE